MAFYNKNIRAPSEGRFNSRRAYTFNGSGGASFGTVITRNVIIFIQCVYIYVFVSHKHRMGSSPLRAYDSVAVNHVRTRGTALEELQHDSSSIRKIIISSIIISSIGIAENINRVQLDLKSMIQEFLMIS